LQTPKIWTTARSGGFVDRRTDIYGLGATLYALATGQAPFDCTDAHDTMEAILATAPPLPSSICPGISGAMDFLILRCMSKDPADRPRSATALLNEMAGFNVAQQRNRWHIEYDNGAGQTEVSVAGEFTGAAVKDFSNAMENIPEDVPLILVNGVAITLLASEALGALVSWEQRLKKEGRRLRIYGLNDSICSSFHLVGLGHLLLENNGAGPDSTAS
jgi:serine/threonine protein kinase